MNQTELLDQFILEARECLEQVGERLLQVEKAPSDAELLNDLFRLVHTLKGNCGLFEFKPLERVVHAGEDLLDRIRNGQLAYSNDIADALLEAMDFTAQMVDEIEQHGAIDAKADGRSQSLASSLRTHLTAKAEGASVTAPAPASGENKQELTSEPAAAPPPAWSARVPAQLLAQHPQGVLWCYEPEAECFFKGEDPWLLAKQAPGLKHIDVGTQAPWPELAEADCYRSNLSLVGLCDAPQVYVDDHFRCVADQVQCVSVAAVVQAQTPAPAQQASAALASATASSSVSKR